VGEVAVSLVLVFGNGLSCGFDQRLATKALTDRVLARLGQEYVEALADLAELGSPEDADHPIGVDRGNFEHLAGPVDRIAEAMTAIQSLIASTDSPVLNDLRNASEALRLQYLRIVGAVLSEVDACCVDRDADENRKAAWALMNRFAAGLVALHKAESSTMFTTNYDSLLMSAMLETGEIVYDGFRYGTLNVPLDPWQNTPALYHFHGSVAWLRAVDGTVQKPKLEYVRAVGAVDEWAAGQPTEGWPSVVLGDLKSRQAARFPFALFYGELRYRLDKARLVVTGGYSFGDKPLNRELALYLASRPENRLLVWSRRPSHENVLKRLQVQLLHDSKTIGPDQVETEAITLPDPNAIDRLITRVRPIGSADPGPEDGRSRST
jgi:hypothetical protein